MRWTTSRAAIVWPGVVAFLVGVAVSVPFHELLALRGTDSEAPAWSGHSVLRRDDRHGRAILRTTASGRGNFVPSLTWAVSHGECSPPAREKAFRPFDTIQVK